MKSLTLDLDFLKTLSIQWRSEPECEICSEEHTCIEEHTSVHFLY